MKTACALTATLLLQAAVAAQQGVPPAGGVPPGAVPPAEVPPGAVPPPGVVPPGRAFNPTNPPPGRPFQAITNPLVQPALTNALPATGRHMATNDPAATATNAATAPATAGTNAAVDFSVTNTISTMAPVQARAVIEVHGGLDTLQNLAASIGGVQNVLQISRSSPQVQQQVDNVSRQIGALAQGEARPSQDILDRLTLDLFRAYTRARATPDVQLVLAVVLNQACNSAQLTPMQVNSAINNAMGALQTAGVPMSLAHPVTCDLHSIAFELQPDLGQ